MNESTTQQQSAFPQLLYALHKRAFSGSVRLSPSEGETIHVCFKDGFLVGTDISSAEDALGRVLLEHGWITEEAFTKSLEEVAKRPAQQMADVWRLQGDVLVEQGAITTAQLKEGRQLRLRRQLNRLFFIKEPSFQMLEGEYPKNGEWSADEKVDPLQVIHHGVCNAFNEQQLAAALEQIEGVTLHPAPGLAERLKRYDLEQDKQTLAEDLTRSSCSLQQAFARSKLDPLQTRMLVYVLWVTEALRADGQEPALEAVVGDTRDRSSGESTQKATEAKEPEASEAPQELSDLLAQYCAGIEVDGQQSAPVEDTVGLGPDEEPARSPQAAAADEEIGPLEEIDVPLPPASQGDGASGAVTPEAGEAPAPSVTAEAAVRGVRRVGTPSGGSAAVVTVSPLETGDQPQPGRRRRISSERDLAALGHLRTNISSILTSVEKIATGEYESIDPVKVNGQKEVRGGRRRPTDQVPRAPDPAGGAPREAAPSPAPGPAAKPPVQREIPLIEQGISAFRDEEYAVAQERFVEAAKQAPGDGRPLAWLAWTRHRAPEIDPHKEPVRNKQLLLRAIQLTPSCADCHYFLGEIYLALGDKGRAGTCFFRTVELRPDHAEAKRRLRRIQEEQKKESGLFGRLFKK